MKALRAAMLALALAITSGATAVASEPDDPYAPMVQAPFDPALSAFKPILEKAMGSALRRTPEETRKILEAGMAPVVAAKGADAPETAPYRAFILAFGGDAANDPAAIDALFAITDRDREATRLIASSVEMLMGMLNVALTPDVLAGRDRLIAILASATEAADGEESAALADAQFRLGTNRTVWGMSFPAGPDRTAKLADGRKWLESAIAMARKTLGPAHPKTTEYMAGLAVSLRREGRLQDAITVGREVVRLRDEGRAPARLRMEGLRDLADMLLDARAFAEAEAAQGRAVAIAGTIPDLSPDTLLYLSSTHADMLGMLGRRAEQEKVLRRNAALAVSDFDRTDHIGKLASFLEDVGRLEEALPHRKALYDMAVAKGDFAKQSGPIMRTTMALANLYTRMGRLAEAERLIKARLDLDQIAFGSSDGKPIVLNNRGELFSTLASLLLHQRRYAEAAIFARYAIDSMKTEDGRVIDESLIFGFQSLLGYAYAGMERYDEAEPLLRAELDIARRIGAPLDVATAQANLAGILERNDKRPEAITLMRAVVASYRAQLGAATAATLDQVSALAGMLAKAGQTAEAAGLYAEVETVIGSRTLMADKRADKRIAHARFQADRGAMPAALTLFRAAERDRADESRANDAQPDERLFMGKVRAAWMVAHPAR